MKVGVLASGSGTNLQALLDAEDVDVAAVASDKPEARALERAQAAGVETRAFPRSEYADRGARDLAMADWLAAQGLWPAVVWTFRDNQRARRFYERLGGKLCGAAEVHFDEGYVVPEVCYGIADRVALGP